MYVERIYDRRRLQNWHKKVVLECLSVYKKNLAVTIPFDEAMDELDNE